jgi:hypothetical protein
VDENGVTGPHLTEQVERRERLTLYRFGDAAAAATSRDVVALRAPRHLLLAEQPGDVVERGWV